jgi:Kef-type K+ transport system membrane component KefB
MVLYDKMVTLTQTNPLTNVGAEFIIAFVNDNTWKTLYLIAIYMRTKMQVNYYFCILKTIMKQMPQNVPMIIIEDFNVDILTKTCQSTILHNFMNTQPLTKHK